MSITEISNIDELDGILANEERGVVIDVWGTWCQPCRILRPHLEQLADDHAAKWRMVAVHVESHPELVDRYDVQSTPTLIYFRDGTEVHRSTGAITPSGVAADLAAHG